MIVLEPDPLEYRAAYHILIHRGVAHCARNVPVYTLNVKKYKKNYTPSGAQTVMF